MGIHVTIETERLPDRLTIPVDAVRASAKGAYVELRRGGDYVPRDVELGERSRGRVEVVSGLEENETVLISRRGGRT